LEDLVAWCAEIARAAPTVPFYYYHIPALNGVHFPMVDFLQQASSQIPNLVGIKYTHDDLGDLRQCLAFEGGRFDILGGRDEHLTALLATGVQGAVGSTYNYAAPLYQQIIRAFQGGDFSRALELQTQSAEMVRVLIGHDLLPAGKTVMRMRGIDCGPVRLPLKTIQYDEQVDLFAELNAIGISNDSLLAMRPKVSLA